PEIWVAPDPGEPAWRVSGEARDEALYADEMGRRLPVGFAKDGAPLWVDLDFFDGTKGAHVSISGVSGVATKTSFALAFLRLLTAHHGIVGPAAANLRALVFNERGLLRFLFTETGDFRAQLTFVEGRVRSQLQRHTVPDPRNPGVAVVEGRPVASLADLVEVIEEHLDPVDSEPELAWTGRVAGGTAQAFMRRLRAAESRIGRLI